MTLTTSSDLVKYISFQRSREHLISWPTAHNSLLPFNSFETVVICEQLYLTFSHLGYLQDFFTTSTPSSPTAVLPVCHEILVPLSLQKYAFREAQYRNLIQSPSLFLTRRQTDQDISYRTAVLNNYFYIKLLDVEIVFFQLVLCRKSSFLTPTCTSQLLLLVFKTRNVLCQEQIELDFPLPCIPNLFGVI